MFLTELGSLELSYSTGGWNTRVHVVLPLPVSVGLIPRLRRDQP